VYLPLSLSFRFGLSSPSLFLSLRLYAPMAQRGKTLAEGEKGMRETLRSWTGMNILRILLWISRP